MKNLNKVPVINWLLSNCDSMKESVISITIGTIIYIFASLIVEHFECRKHHQGCMHDHGHFGIKFNINNENHNWQQFECTTPKVIETKQSNGGYYNLPKKITTGSMYSIGIGWHAGKGLTNDTVTYKIISNDTDIHK